MTNTWNASEGDFATRLTLNDVPGFFSKQLTIAQGTRALIIDNGTYLGEVPPGTYTLQTFGEKLQFWKSQKQVDVILVRQDDMPLNFHGEKIATADELLVSVKVRLVVQIQDTAVFARNLLGARPKLNAEEMGQIVSPIITQALRETIRQLNIAALCTPEVRPLLLTGIKEATQTSLLRYGIVCADLHVASISNEQYDEQRRKTGESVLLDLSTEQQRKLDEVLDKETLRKISHREREIELNVLAENVELDQQQSEVALKLRRNEVKKDMRDAVLSNKFDDIKTSEEFDVFCLEIDKQKLLREDERHELEMLYESKKDDRKTAREFLARKLELDRNAELDQIAAAIRHAQKVKTLQHEIELAGIANDEETRRWRELLQKESEKSDHDYQEAVKNMQRQHELNAKNLKFLRTEEWEQLLQKQKTTRLEGEIAEERTALEIRTRRINDEYEDEQKRRKYAFDKEVQSDQMAQLREMQKMNQEQDEHEANLLLKTEAQRHQQKIDELNTKATMSAEALIATSDTANAERLAKIQISKNESAVQSEMHEKVAKLQEQRLQDAQKNNETTLAAIQAITGQAFGAMGQVARPATPAPGTPNSPAVRVVVCSGCRTENPTTSKFCAKCGKEL